jgi:threonine dehydratase
VRGAALDALYVPCSGGGLVAGSALAIKSFFPQCAVYAVEPAGYDDLGRSLAAGERVTGAGGHTTLCDGLQAPLTGVITFAINRRELAGAVAVDDVAVRAAMVAAMQHLKVVVEPSGAAALAAVLASPPRHCRSVGVILSGGNVDASVFADVLRAGL